MQIIEEKVRAFLAQMTSLGEAELAAQTPLLSVGIIDSFTLLELVSYVEKEFRIIATPRDLTLENFDSIERITHYIERARKVAGNK